MVTGATGRQGRATADAARAANVQHFIYASVARAERSTGISHFENNGGNAIQLFE